jgi:hypothetical protein
MPVRRRMGDMDRVDGSGLTLTNTE